jgi:hypothetical protein
MSLRSKILRLSVKSLDGRNFFPEKDVAALPEDDLRLAVRSSIEEVYRRDEAVQLVLRGGRKVFALLIILNEESMLVNFLETDTALSKSLDSRLPLTESALLSLFANSAHGDVIAKEFFDRQWEFIAPLFRLDISHRFFDDMTVMPFVWGSKTSAGEGAFGYVDKVTLHARHQGFESGQSSPV